MSSLFSMLALCKMKSFLKDVANCLTSRQPNIPDKELQINPWIILTAVDGKSHLRMTSALTLEELQVSSNCSPVLKMTLSFWDSVITGRNSGTESRDSKSNCIKVLYLWVHLNQHHIIFSPVHCHTDTSNGTIYVSLKSFCCAAITLDWYDLKSWIPNGGFSSDLKQKMWWFCAKM